MRIYCLLVFFTFVLNKTTFSQSYIQTNYHYNLEKGLETRNIRSTFKDSRGFMWIATDVGAYRFDGFEFRPYKRNIKHNVPLSVERISEDKEGNLWFYHFNYSESSADFSILPTNSSSLIPIKDYLNGALPFPIEECFDNVPRTNNENGIWITNRNTREVYEYFDGAFHKIGTIPPYVDDGDGKHPHTFFNLDKDSAGTNWMAYNGFLYRANGAKGYERYEKLPISDLYFRIDKSDRFWFALGNEVFLKESKDTPISKPKFLKNIDLEKVEHFRIESINDQFIVASCGSISETLLIDHRCNHVTPILNLNDSSIIQITPTHINVDRTNTVWLSTYEGVFQIGFQKNPFKKYLKGKSTRGIFQYDDDNLSIASYSGFYNANTKTGKEELIDPNINLGQGIYADAVSKNKYWLGGPVKEFFGIQSFDPFEKELQEVDLEEGTVFNFYKHENDPRLWAGTEFGLCVYDENKNKFIKYDKINKFSKIKKTTIFDFESIDESNFLIATSSGIYQLNIQQGLVDHFYSGNNNFPYDFITYIHKDESDQSLWVGTKMGGLMNWDFPDGKLNTITTQNGLADNTIYAIRKDISNPDFLWLPSNNGLMHFNKKTNEVTTYKVEDGICHNEFNFNSNYIGPDSTFYFGGIQGITSFHTNDIKVSDSKPQLYVSTLEFLSEGESIKVQYLEDSKPIELNQQNKLFKVSLTLADYENPRASKYFSKIEGVDSDWISMEGNLFVVNGLPSGNNTISFKAKNANGIWAQNQIDIPIKMLPPFYFRWWFVALMSFLLIGLVTIFIKRRTYKLEKDKENLELEVARRTQKIQEDKTLIEQQAAELQQLDEIKSRFFSNVTHELRTPLTLIIGPLQQLLKSDNLDSVKARKTLQSISQNGDQLKQLVEEILDLNRLDARKILLNKAPIRLKNLIEKWINNFNPEAENRGINFKLDYSASTNLYLNMDAQKLERIVVNLLSNAFKYSENGDTIKLKVTEAEQQMKIVVEDTGLGIHEADLPHIFERFYQTKQAENSLMGGLGIGLALSKELSELMGGKLSVTSKLGVGSTFEFSFPKEAVEGILKPSVNQNLGIIQINTERPDVIVNRRLKNILVVEDNRAMQSFVIDLLDKVANVHTANNGKLALEFLENQTTPIDLIVSDVMMPEMDGFTFLKLIRQRKEWQLTPIVFLTARADIIDRIKAFTIGVDDYLVKPFEPDELIARVKNLLDKITSRQEIEISDEKESVIEKSSTIEKKSATGLELINEFEETESADLIWLKNLEQKVIDNIEQPNFNVSQLAFMVHIGERQLGRKLKKLTGMTPGSYLKEVRLQKARHLLENKTFSTISEVAFHVGFKTPEYFSKIFKARFGKLPTTYLKSV